MQERYNLIKYILCLLTALNPGTGAEAAFFPHSHGAHEITAVSSTDSEKVLLWIFGSTGAPRCPAASQTHQEKGQGGAL